MSPKEVEAFVRANAGKLALLTWADGESGIVLLEVPDEEGFLHSDLNGEKPRHFWSRFEDIRSAEVRV